MTYQEKLKEWKKRRERIMRMLSRGVSESEVARKFGITRQRVNQLAVRSK